MKKIILGNERKGKNTWGVKKGVRGKKGTGKPNEKKVGRPPLRERVLWGP